MVWKDIVYDAQKHSYLVEKDPNGAILLNFLLERESSTNDFLKQQKWLWKRKLEDCTCHKFD